MSVPTTYVIPRDVAVLIYRVYGAQIVFSVGTLRETTSRIR